MVKYADSPTVTVEVEIDTSTADVWPLVCDINLPARFSEEFQGGRWIDDGEPMVGSRFRGTNRHPAVGEWSTVCTIISYEPERTFRWVVGEVDNVTATWGFDLESIGERTRLRMGATMGPGPSGLSVAIEARPDREDDIVARRLEEWKSNMTETIEGIKALAESA